MASENKGKELKTLIATAGVTLVLVGILNIILSFACQEIIQHSVFRLSRISHGNIHVDAVIVGNSRAVNLSAGTDRKSGPSIFNLGFNGLGRPAIFALAKDYFDAGNTSRTLIVEVSGVFSATPNCELKPYWGLLKNLSSEGRVQCENDAFYARLLPLTQYNSELFLRGLFYIAGHGGTDQNWANDYKMTAGMCSLFKTTGDADLRVDSSAQSAQARNDVNAFNAWMTLHAPHTQVIYVLAPYLTTVKTAPQVQAVVQAATNLLGQKFNNMSGDLGGDCSSFADAVHVNEKGRKLMAAKLIQLTKNSGASP